MSVCSYVDPTLAQKILDQFLIMFGIIGTETKKFVSELYSKFEIYRIGKNHSLFFGALLKGTYTEKTLTLQINFRVKNSCYLCSVINSNSFSQQKKG